MELSYRSVPTASGRAAMRGTKSRGSAAATAYTVK